MNSTVLRLYRIERANGNPASVAHSNARTRYAFEQAKREGLVRLSVIPDDDGSSVLDFDCEDKACQYARRSGNYECKVHKAERERANNDGVYGIVGEYCPTGDECDDIWHSESRDGHRTCGCEWEHADSVWGFIGDDWKSSGYDIDVMSATLAALSNARMRLVA